MLFFKKTAEILLKTAMIIGSFTVISAGVARIDQLDSLQYSVMDFDFTDILYSKMLTDSLVVQDTNVVIVNVGNVSRDEIAEQINRITAQKPRVIGINIFFMADGGAKDSILVNALKKSPSVVLCSKMVTGHEENEEIIWDSLETSHSKFLLPHIKVGSTSLVAETPDFYQSTRLFPVYEQLKTRKEYHFAVEIASLYDSTKVQKLLARNKPIELIDYKGGANISNIQAPKRFQMVDAHEVLDSAFDLRFLKNKVVLMGYFGSNLGQLSFEDIHFTPMNPQYVGRSLPDSYGVMIHANIISQILEERYINTLPETMNWALEFGILGLFTALLVFFYQGFPENYGIFSKISAFVLINLLIFVALFFYKYFSFKFDFRAILFYLVFMPDGYEYYQRYLFKFYHFLQEKIIRK